MIPKPGYKTTEFAVTVLTAIGALAAALAGELTPRYAAIASAVATGAYAVSRGITKLGVYLNQPPPSSGGA
jgi:hypothetical protein